MVEPSTLGGRIRKARSQIGLSPTDLAKALGLRSTVQITLWETDQRAPGSKRLGDIAQALGASSDWLLTGKGNATERHAVPRGTNESGNGTPPLSQALRVLAAEFELEAEKRGAPEWAMDHFRYSLRNPDATRMFRFGQDGRVLSSDEQITAMRQHIMKLRALLDAIIEEMRAAHEAGTDRPGPGDGSPI